MVANPVLNWERYVSTPTRVWPVAPAADMGCKATVARLAAFIFAALMALVPSVSQAQQPLDETPPDKIAPPERTIQYDQPQAVGPLDAESRALIRADQARSTYQVTGAGLTLAVLDTGLRITHVDFANPPGKVPARRNFTPDDGGNVNLVTDGDGHGTNVAGVAVGNGTHIGIAPGGRVIPLKVLRNDGSGTFSWVQQALDWVIANRTTHNITVVNLSLGDSSNRVSYGNDAIRSRIQTLRNARVAVVIAAGNDFYKFDSRQGMSYPGIVPEGVSVGAVYDANIGGPITYGDGGRANTTGPDRFTPFSQRLHTNTGGSFRTDIFAPGAALRAAGSQSDNGESTMQGTSQAAPVVAGVIMLIQQHVLRATGQLPTVDQLEGWLRSSATNLVDGDDENDNVTNTGLTFPRVDALAALQATGFPPPSGGVSNDNFANRATLTGGAATAQGNNAGATKESGEPNHAGNAGGRSLWWTWTAPAGGTVTLTTAGSNFDTTLAVYTGSAVNSLTTVAANDDAPGGGTTTSLLTFTATAGVVYQFAVDGYNAATGNIVLNLTLEQAGSLQFSSATYAVSENVENGVFSLTVQRVNGAGGTVAVSYAAASGTASLGGDFTLTPGTLTFGPGETQKLIVVGIVNDPTVEPDETFTVTLSSPTGGASLGSPATSTVTILNDDLPVGTPSNDSFAAAKSFPAGGGSQTGSNRNATKQSGEPNHAGNSGGASIWWTWAAVTSGPVTISTAGSNFDTTLAVYTGSAVNSLTTVAANDDAAGSLTSQVTFTSVAGTTYRIAVDGYNGAVGDVTLLITVSGTPVNDSFSNPVILSGTVASAVGTNVNATKQSGEPNHAGNGGGKSVWYRWVAPQAGSVSISTSGSSIDTLLAVYTGNNVSSLTLVAANDDDPAGGTLTSRVTFNAVSGVTYQIAVDGYNAAAGSVSLSVRQGLPTTSDIIGNGRSQLLVRNRTTGQVQAWAFNGINIEGVSTLLTVPTKTAASSFFSGDTDGDGKADLVQHNITTGQVTVHKMDGSTIVSSLVAYTLPTTGRWRLRGVGDFNGDGRADVLAINLDNGQSDIRFLNGATVIGGGASFTNPDPLWTVAGVADLDGDGRADILWYHPGTGDAYAYLMNGTEISGGGLVFTNTDTKWQIVGVADFNGDGRADVMWYHPFTGQAYVYLLNGLSILGGGLATTNSDPDWQIVATGDYDGDGRADLLWRNRRTGQLMQSQLNGTQVVGGGMVNASLAFNADIIR